MDAIRWIRKDEGIKGLYKGTIASVMSQSVARMIFITTYEMRKK